MSSGFGRIGGVALAVGGGTMIAAQTRINGELAGRLHNGVAAAVISFGSGLTLMAFAVAASRPARAGLARVASLLRRWGAGHRLHRDSRGAGPPHRRTPAGVEHDRGSGGGAVVLDLVVPGGAGRPGGATIAGAALTLLAVAIVSLSSRTGPQEAPRR